jgi:hypothetical protein
MKAISTHPESSHQPSIGGKLNQTKMKWSSPSDKRIFAIIDELWTCQLTADQAYG